MVLQGREEEVNMNLSAGEMPEDTGVKLEVHDRREGRHRLI